MASPTRRAPAWTIPPNEVTWTAIRAQGAGGQNVNKVSSAIHLRFDISSSTLPAEVKARLVAGGDQRITPDGVVIIKAQRHRTQERNLADAMLRLQGLIENASYVPPIRRPTKPTKGAQKRRVEGKVKRGRIKAARGKVFE